MSSGYTCTQETATNRRGSIESPQVSVSITSLSASSPSYRSLSRPLKLPSRFALFPFSPRLPHPMFALPEPLSPSTRVYGNYATFATLFSDSRAVIADSTRYPPSNRQYFVIIELNPFTHPGGKTVVGMRMNGVPLSACFHSHSTFSVFSSISEGCFVCVAADRRKGRGTAASFSSSSRDGHTILGGLTPSRRLFHVINGGAIAYSLSL